MKITTLLENSKKDDKFHCNHGLSIYIEANGKKILLDTGQDDSFIYNARLLGVDISDVDFVVISHFHYDHAGGLKAFLAHNKKAEVYISREAFDDYFVSVGGKMEYFGLDKAQYDMDRFIFVDKEYRISDKIIIISKLNYNFNNPLNEKFYKKVGTEYIKDDFFHEAALIINEGENSVLLSGCFHSGVVNSIKRALQDGIKITHAVGGFHLAGSGSNQITPEYFKELTDFLFTGKIKSYTGHCTGPHYLSELKKMLPDYILPIYTGSEHEI